MDQLSQPSGQAFLLALLTAGGGLTGYIRTGSVPSVAAGMTVGALVSFSMLHPFFARLPADPDHSTASEAFGSVSVNLMAWN
ncbi:hypothetical protein MMC21_000372 [Puttea exsequens]|nr:hypothetical protein [Puttea exsequens]